MVHTSSFPSYKYHIKNEVINNYSVFCNIDKCSMFVENSILLLDMAVTHTNHCNTLVHPNYIYYKKM